MSRLRQCIVSILVLCIPTPAGAQDQFTSGTITSATCPGAGCVTLSVAGVGVGAIQITGTWSGTITAQGSVDGTNYVSAAIVSVPTGATTTTTTTNGVWLIGIAGLKSIRLTGTAWTSGTATVTIRASQGTQDTITRITTATTAVSSVAGSASSVACLAANSDRVGATVYNDSTADVYVKLGATASATSFTVKLFQDGFFTIPFGYTGVIDCIWTSATGSARVTEVTQ